MVPCKCCGESVSVSAKMCPHCGHQLRMSDGEKFASGLLFAILMWCGGTILVFYCIYSFLCSFLGGLWNAFFG